MQLDCGVAGSTLERYFDGWYKFSTPNTLAASQVYRAASASPATPVFLVGAIEGQMPPPWSRLPPTYHPDLIELHSFQNMKIKALALYYRKVTSPDEVVVTKTSQFGPTVLAPSTLLLAALRNPCDPARWDSLSSAEPLKFDADCAGVTSSGASCAIDHGV